MLSGRASDWLARIVEQLSQLLTNNWDNYSTLGGGWKPPLLGDDLLDDFAVDVGQAEVAAAVAEGEAGVVDAE